jgi:hypothetical protein
VPRKAKIPAFVSRVSSVRALHVPILVLAASVAAGCATPRAPLPPPPTVGEIVELGTAGVPAGDIIKRMRDARAVYRLPASALARLHGRGVPDQVIDYMQRTHIEAERYEEYLRTRDLYLGYGWPAYHGVYPYGYSYPGWWP